MNSGPFMDRAIQIFGAYRWNELDHALNQMAWTFLRPPPPELLQAARADFLAGLQTPSTKISSYLFATTSYYFQHQTEMPACADLAEFRGANAEQIWTLRSDYTYFHLWRSLTYKKVLAIWVIALVALIVLALRQQTNVSASVACAIAFTTVGVGIFGSSCFLHDYEPRLSLSMWQLLLLSLFLLVGRAVDLLTRQRDSDMKQSAGQLPRLG